MVRNVKTLAQKFLYMSNNDSYIKWKKWDESDFFQCAPLEKIYFAAEMNRAVMNSEVNIKIFELGFGNGSFASFAISRNWDYYGSEINMELLERAIRAGIKVVKGGIDELIELGHGGTFDAVVAFDVIEHLNMDEIEDFLLNANIILRPGGVILARCPSGDSPFGRAIFYGDITHKTVLGSSAVEQLARLVGMDLVYVGEPRFPVIGVGIMRGFRRAGLWLARRVISSVINTLFHNGQSRVITSNLVFILRKKPKVFGL